MPPWTSMLLAFSAAAALSSCATTPTGKLDAKSAAVLTEMTEKLAAARTLRANTASTASPGFHEGIATAESTRGTIAVRRPDQLAARVKTNEGSRSFGLDGNHLTVVDHSAATHAVVAAPGDIDRAVGRARKTYGATPPVADLLANDPRAALLQGVRSGRHTGTESIGGIPCDRLAFEQDGLDWQLWVATGDKLPRRIALAYANRDGGAPHTLTTTLTRWELDARLSDAELAVIPPSGSLALEMIPLK